MNLFCVGLSHHTANVETRERFAGRAESEYILRNSGCAEALLLTTCNRVEVYAASEKRVSTDDIARCLSREDKDGSAVIERRYSATAFYRYENEKCVQHLFRVASGLDSMVVGDSEIELHASSVWTELPAPLRSARTPEHHSRSRSFVLFRPVGCTNSIPPCKTPIQALRLA